jgi:hypothetical protein
MPCLACTTTAPLGFVYCSGLFLALTALFPLTSQGCDPMAAALLIECRGQDEETLKVRGRPPATRAHRPLFSYRGPCHTHGTHTAARPLLAAQLRLLHPSVRRCPLALTT